MGDCLRRWVCYVDLQLSAGRPYKFRILHNISLLSKQEFWLVCVSEREREALGMFLSLAGALI